MNSILNLTDWGTFERKGYIWTLWDPWKKFGLLAKIEQKKMKMVNKMVFKIIFNISSISFDVQK